MPSTAPTKGHLHDNTLVRYYLNAAEIDEEQRRTWRHQIPRRVRLKGDAVEYDYVYADGPWSDDVPEASFGFLTLPETPPERSGRATLIAFLDLADASPRRIAEFVRRHGPLGLCVHGWPRTHRPIWTEVTPRAGFLCMDVSDGGSAGSESIGVIRFWARLARATVAVAASLRSIETPSEIAAEWEAAFGRPLPPTRNEREAAVNRVLNYLWLPLGMVAPEVVLGSAPRVRTTTFAGIIGILVLQLLRTTLTSDVAFCSACMRALEVDRQPQQGRDVYCGADDCRRTQWRRAKQRERRAGPKRRIRTRSATGSDVG